MKFIPILLRLTYFIKHSSIEITLKGNVNILGIIIYGVSSKLILFHTVFGPWSNNISESFEDSVRSIHGICTNTVA